MRNILFLFLFILCCINGEITQKFVGNSKNVFSNLVIDSQSNSILAGRGIEILKLNSEFKEIDQIKLENVYNNAVCDYTQHENKLLYKMPLSPNLFVICYQSILEDRKSCNLLDTERSVSSCFFVTSNKNTRIFLESPNYLLATSSTSDAFSTHLLEKASLMTANKNKNFIYSIPHHTFVEQNLLDSYESGQYIYIISTREKKNATSSQVSTFVTRICRENMKESLVETSLTCSSRSGVVLTKALHAQTHKDFIIVAFESTQHSGICVYKKVELEARMDEVVEKCVKEGEGFNESPFLKHSPEATCSQSLRDGCSQGHAIFSDTPIDTTSFTSTTSPTSHLLIHHGILYVPLQHATISRFKLEENESSNELSLVELSALDDLIGQEKEGHHSNSQSESIVQLVQGFKPWQLIVLTPNSVVSMVGHTCGTHPTCSSCPFEPPCIWCHQSQSCTVNEECPSSSSFETTLCFTPITASPHTLPIHQANTVQFNFSLVQLLPREVTSLTCEAHLAQVEVGASDVSTPISFLNDSSVVTCDPFTPFKTSLIDPHLSEVELDLKLKWHGVVVASSPVHLFDCSKFNSCSLCRGSRHACDWSNSDHVCSSVSPDISHTQKSMECASIHTEEDTALIPVEHATDLHLVATHLTEGMLSEGLYCILDSKHHFPATVNLKKLSMVGGEGIEDQSEEEDVRRKRRRRRRSVDEEEYVVSCTIKLQEDLIEEAQVLMSVDVGWGASKKLLENKQQMKVEVYNCNKMASNCGLCLLLDKKYACKFCYDNQCSFMCPSKSEIRRDPKICPDHHIEGFEPRGAPLNSQGTLLIVHGFNLALESNAFSVTVMGKPCEVSERSEELFQPTLRLACELASSSEEGSGKVLYGSKYPVLSSQEFVFKNPEVKSLQPIKGPRSGGTLVTIYGENMDFGTRAQVQVNQEEAVVLSRNSSCILILTPSSNSSSTALVVVVVDGVVLKEDVLRFNYLDDPTVDNISPLASLLSGGNSITVRGNQFKSVQHPQMVVYLPEHNVTTNCISHSNTYLSCLAPDLRECHLDPPKPLHFGFLMDGVESLLKLDKEIWYHALPSISPLDQPVSYYNTLHNKLVLEGSNLAVLNEFTDFYVNVNQATCDVKTSNETNISCDLPDPHKVLLNDDMSADLILTLGNYRRVVGVVSYYKRSHLLHLLIACLVAIALLILVVVISTLLCVMRRRRRRKEYSNSFLLKPAQKVCKERELAPPPSPPREEEPQDDQAFFRTALQRIEGSRIRGIARSIFIKREHIQLRDLIGNGCFSKVHLATIYSQDFPKLSHPCVKIILDNNLAPEAIEHLIRDVSVMSSFNHPNVLKVLAFSIGHQKQPWVVLPHMPNGDLRTHVKDKSKSFTARQLLQLSQKVAGGMAYLSNLNIVHKQLCAKNCLLDEQFEVKISDYGLTTELLKKSYLSPAHYCNLPLRWWAPESIENFVFTSKSDVWSYGVLLWELMTRGVLPYPDIQPNQIGVFLKSSRRLKKPKYCPNNVYQMVSECWLDIPERRPTFTDLVNRLELLLNPPRKRSQADSESIAEPLYINHNDTPAQAPPPRVRF